MNKTTIPTFNMHGVLPVGTHICTLEDVKLNFSNIPDIKIRSDLYIKLEEFFNELSKNIYYFKGLLIDGSYVTNKTDPSDVDVGVILDEYGDATSLPQSVLRLLNSDFIKQNYGFSMFIAYKGGESEKSLTEFFQDQEPPNHFIQKGILKVIT